MPFSVGENSHHICRNEGNLEKGKGGLLQKACPVPKGPRLTVKSEKEEAWVEKRGSRRR